MYCIRCELNTPHCPYCTNCGGDVVPRTVSPGDKPTVVTRAVSSEVVDVGIEFSKGGTVTATLNDDRFGGHMVWIPEWH